MNSRTHSHYLLIGALLLLGACHQGVTGPKKTATIERQWPATAITRLEVGEVDGSVSVEAGATDKITLVARVTSRGVDAKPNAENQGWFETRVEGGTLVIGRKERERRSFWMKGDNVSIDYELHVPPQVALELTTVNGRIVTRGIEGRTEAVTVNGPLDLESAGTQEMTANAVNGSIRAKFLTSFQGARFKTVNGGVEAILPQNASFSVDLSQVNGDFEATFPLSIHSNPGSRRVSGEINGGQHELRIVTVNGDVEVLHLPKS
ncbi:MAG TPA: DUF4097 family beta strand repeat-containing protein [Thermoanaerobaculia bacterium]